MELHLLIAEPRQERRELLRTIYSASPLVTSIDEATSDEELCYKLEHTQPDFVVVHQSLITGITDISLLPRGHFVILATEFDQRMLLATYTHGTPCYFLDNPLPVAMLLASLNPTGVEWLLEHLSRTESSDMKKVLTAHQQTFLALWNEGLTSSDIAEQLILSNGTVKKELETIRKKLQKHHVSGIMRKGRVKKERTYKKYVFERLYFMHNSCMLVLVVQIRSLSQVGMIICRSMDECHYLLPSCLSGYFYVYCWALSC